MITSHRFLTVPWSPLSAQHSASSPRRLSPLFYFPYYGSFSSSPRYPSIYPPHTPILTFFFSQTLLFRKRRKGIKGTPICPVKISSGFSAALFPDLLFLSTLTQQLPLQSSLPVLRIPSPDWIHQGCEGGSHLCTLTMWVLSKPMSVSDVD